MPSPLPIDQLPEEQRRLLERTLRDAVRYAALGAIADLRERHFVQDDLAYRRFAVDVLVDEIETLYRRPIYASKPPGWKL